MSVSRRQFLTYTGAGVGALVLARAFTGCDPAADKEISGTVDWTGQGQTTVPAGQLWEFDPDVSTTVTVDANVIVRGTLRMRPNPGVTHTLRFVNVNEANYVGGGTQVLASDVGLWVMDAGILDAQGQPKAGWNRTGDDSTWTSTDELVVAPNAAQALSLDPPAFASFTKGGNVPSVSYAGTVHKTEVANLTRNVRIEGTAAGRAHVFILSTQPQTLRNIAIRYMGPRQNNASVLGRYGLHFHMCGDNSRGSVVQGVVVRDCGGPAFVPHMSNGVTFTDCVAYRSTGKGYWWDDNTTSDDVSYDHCAAFSVLRPTSGTLSGFHLNKGTNVSCTDSVAAGCVCTSVTSGGFHWPENQWGSWLFTGCVAHNNYGPGVSSWQNTNPDKQNLIDDFVCYRNGDGISDGAYLTAYQYRNAVCFDNIYRTGGGDVAHRAAGTTFDHCTFEKVVIAEHHTLTNPPTAKYLDCKIGSIVVNESPNTAAIPIEFHSTTAAHDLAPSDFQVIVKRSPITVYNSDGSSFTV